MVVIESVVTRDLLTGEDEEASVYYVYDGEEVPDILRDSVGLNVHVDENSAMDVTAGTHSVLVTRFSAKESSKYKKKPFPCRGRVVFCEECQTYRLGRCQHSQRI
eukprot:Rmarinus@m.5620